MMQQLGQYVVSLTAAALVCSLLLSLIPAGSTRKLLRLVCGIFLTVTALSPLPGLELPDLGDMVSSYRQEGEALAAMGAEQAREEQRQGIKQALETYILDKAAALGADIQPAMTLNPDGTIRQVRLTGHAKKDVWQQLAAILTNELGIPEENQQWTLEN